MCVSSYSYTLYYHTVVSCSQTPFFLLCGGRERKGSGEHSIAPLLGYPEILGIQLHSFRILNWYE